MTWLTIIETRPAQGNRLQIDAHRIEAGGMRHSSWWLGDFSAPQSGIFDPVGDKCVGPAVPRSFQVAPHTPEKSASDLKRKMSSKAP